LPLQVAIGLAGTADAFERDAPLVPATVNQSKLVPVLRHRLPCIKHVVASLVAESGSPKCGSSISTTQSRLLVSEPIDILARNAVAGVEDVLAVLNDEIKVQVIMVRDEHDGVGPPKLIGREFYATCNDVDVVFGGP